MKLTTIFFFAILLALSLIIPAPAPAAETTIQAPVLKWSNAGCFSSWCETGWYSSPAVADLDGDGAPEVIASAYSIVVLDGATGALKWRMPSGHDRSQPSASNVGRTWPGIAVADLENDGTLEIITAHSGGYVSVYNNQGYFKSGWPKQPTTSELRGLSLADLDGNRDLEVIVTAAVGSKTNTWVYEHTGALRAGWPQLSNDSGYAYGIFNDNVAVGDIDGDGNAELVVPSDVHYINAYKADGSQIPANAAYGDKGWGKVGVWESLATELRGWGTCDSADARPERYRANFAHGPAAIADLNNDGYREIAVTGNMYDCIPGYPSKYTALYLLHPDRWRFSSGAYDWSNIPTDTGAPLSEDYNVIENAQPNPVIADLDGDHQKEVLFPSYDGRVHAFWLDKSEHGEWPYSVYQPAEGFYRFASEPVVADLDNNGRAEVIFASWTQKGSGATGKLFILDYLGNPLHVVNLPAAYGSPDWNGALAAPTLANVDLDLDLEIVLNTAHSGMVAYDLPGTSQARVMWMSGRGNFLRNAEQSLRLELPPKIYLPILSR
jgi:hypothetical protein